MLDGVKNTESSLVYVNFMTGLTALLLGIIFSWILKPEVSAEQAVKSLPNLSGIEISLVFLLVLFGFFVYGVRYFFFDLYRTKIFSRVKRRQQKKNERRIKRGQEIPKEFKREEGHSFISWLIKYAFRNGTTVEEVIAANKRWKKDMATKGRTDEFDWIGTATYPSFDMWKYTNYINNRHPEANIYRFYYHSEVFQCLDTLFLTMFVVSLVKFLFMLATATFNSAIQLIALSVYVFCMLVFHLLSKVSGKASIRRFFLEIAVGLTDCKDIHLPYQKASVKE